MEQTIKAIETVYKGYRFRSRLEARWAVFFDELGTKWDYETEGYKCGDICYLPDFVIDNDGVNVVVEIKPTDPTTREVEKAKMVVMKLPAIMAIMCGSPYQVFEDKEDRSLYLDYEGSVRTLDCWELLLCVGALSLSKFNEISAEIDREEDESKKDGLVMLNTILPIIHCRRAAKKARKARFEFGESG